VRRRSLPVILTVLIAACGAAAGSEPDPSVTRVEVLSPLPTVPTGLPASTTPTTATTAPPPRAPVAVGFAGDTSFTHGLAGRDPLGDVIELLTAPDLTAANLETTVAETDVGSPLDKRFIFKSPPGSVEVLTAAGVDVVSLANNHTLDYRRDGLLRTMELLDAGSILHFGAGVDPAAAYAPVIARAGEWTIAFVGFTRVECGWVSDDPTRWPEAAWACPGFEDRTVAAVAEAADSADVTVVMVHWGIELDHCPQPHQRELAAAWVEAGAELVIGSHPHVLQGIERINDAWIVYSTGNFAFPSARGPSARSAYYEAELAESGVTLRVTPVTIVEGRPRPAAGDAASAILDDLAAWSFGWEPALDGEIRQTEATDACARS
jgi:poly-gamma-glutamate capsule biosynthesis protein CapA/YwtB (metallophosphatase superfamily)